jgi:hypothetical protein
MLVQAQKGSGIQPIRNLALEGDGCSEQGSGCFNPQERIYIYGAEGWVSVESLQVHEGA